MADIGFGRANLINKIITTNFRVEPISKRYSYQELLFIVREMLQEEHKYLLDEDSSARLSQFKQFVKFLFARNLGNYDTMLLLTGGKGSSKSSVAMMIAKAWCEILGIKFDPKKYIAYNNMDLLRKCQELPAWSPLIADEAVRFASSEDWNKAQNKELKKHIAQIRTRHFLFILCFPLKPYKLDKTYLNSNVNYWCDLVGRGKGILYAPDLNPAQDPWRIKAFEDLGNYNEFTPLSQIEKILRKHPNFWTTIRFPKPSKKLYDQYLNVRERNVYDNKEVMDAVSKEEIYKSLLVLVLRDIMTHDSTISINRVILQIKNEYNINISKQMVEEAIEDSKNLVIRLKESAVQEI